MTGLMSGKRGLVMGVANDHSIAWGIARVLHQHGAELAFTYQGENFGRRVKPLADSVGAELLLPADVQDDATLDAAFAEIGEKWGRLDFLIHAIAYSDKKELQGASRTPPARTSGIRSTSPATRSWTCPGARCR